MPVNIAFDNLPLDCLTSDPDNPQNGYKWFNVTEGKFKRRLGGVTVSSANHEDLTDEKAKVSANDTTTGYLSAKLVAGSNVVLTELDDGENETLEISATGGGGSGNLDGGKSDTNYGGISPIDGGSA